MDVHVIYKTIINQFDQIWFKFYFPVIFFDDIF